MVYKAVELIVFSYYNDTEKLLEILKKKKVGVAGLQPTLISLDYSKLSN